MNSMNKIILAISILFLVGFLWAKGTSPSQGIQIESDEAKILVSSGALLLDVRTEDEFNDSHIPGAVFLPYDEINAASAAKLIKTLDTPIVVYCRSGRRSDIAAKTLIKLGYTKVRDLGSITNWKK